MRRKIFGIAVIALCGAIQVAAQQPHPKTIIDQMLGPHAHMPAAPLNAPHTPEVFFDATSLGSPLLLDKGWRVGISGNPAVAKPEFDDSTWALRDAQESFADVPDEDHPGGPPDRNPKAGHPKDHQRPFAWFRLHLKLARNHGPIALLVELPPSQNASISSETIGLDVFANGRQIHPEGPHGDSPERYQQISRIYDLNLAPSETDLTLVIRSVYIPLGYGAYTGFFSSRRLRLGNREDLDRALELWRVHSLFERLPRLVNAILLTVLALFLLALFFTQKGHIEYLWLALYELLQAPLGFVDLAGSSARLDHLWYLALVLQLVVVSAYLYFEFLVAFLALRKTLVHSHAALQRPYPGGNWPRAADRWPRHS